MKKNIAMRVAAILFILTMISTCAFSTTFAKYVTSDEATDTARVAKWGVKVDVEGKDAFKTEYASNTTGVTGNTVVTSNAVGADGKKLVAPGTDGVLTTLTISGTPEVMVDIDVASTLSLTGWEAGNYGDPVTKTECPIVFKVYLSTSSSDLTTLTTVTKEFKIAGYADAAALAAAIDAYIETELNEDNYAANTNLQRCLKVTWEWAYEGGNDANDTALGNLAAEATAPAISYELKVTVTQVD